MTRTEDRLADALGAVADGVREETMRPLVAPPAARPRPRWVAPAAAAASVAVLAGLVTGAVAVAGAGAGKPPVPPKGSVPPAGPAAAAGAPRYVVVAGLDGQIAVRSTATGRTTAVLPLRGPGGYGRVRVGVVASAGNGLFVAAGIPPDSTFEKIYRFRVTSAGKVTGLAPVPHGLLAAGELVDALAVTPGGRTIAYGSLIQPGSLKTDFGDRVNVVDTVTGDRSWWDSGRRGQSSAFSVASLSWTADGRLAVFGEWCRLEHASGFHSGITCPAQQQYRSAEAWLLHPVPNSGDHPIEGGQRLLRQTPGSPYLAQAVISPDGRTLTVLELTGRKLIAQHYLHRPTVPCNLAVRQYAVPSGRPLRVLYHNLLGPRYGIPGAPDFLSLARDSTGQHWTVIGAVSYSFNGWIYRGRLVPLAPQTFHLSDGAFEAW